MLCSLSVLLLLAPTVRALYSAADDVVDLDDKSFNNLVIKSDSAAVVCRTVCGSGRLRQQKTAAMHKQPTPAHSLFALCLQGGVLCAVVWPLPKDGTSIQKSSQVLEGEQGYSLAI